MCAQGSIVIEMGCLTYKKLRGWVQLHMKIVNRIKTSVMYRLSKSYIMYIHDIFDCRWQEFIRDRGEWYQRSLEQNACSRVRRHVRSHHQEGKT